MPINQYLYRVRDEPGLWCPSWEDGVLPSDDSEDAHLGFLLPHKPDQSPQAASARGSEIPSMEIFMCGILCGYRRVMQAMDSLGAQKQGGLAEIRMETYHPSAWRGWSP